MKTEPREGDVLEVRVQGYPDRWEFKEKLSRPAAIRLASGLFTEVEERGWRLIRDGIPVAEGGG